MGITCNKKKKQNEAIIQNQIKLAVLEDENLNKQESISRIVEPQDEYFREQILQPEIDGLISLSKKQATQSDEEETKKQKKKKVKKKTTNKKDENYLKIIEYSNLKIQSLILTNKEDDTTTFYELTLGFQFQEYSYNVNCKAIILCESIKPFYLTPTTFQGAAQNSNYQPFFIQDTYFNIDLTQNSNLQSFNQLLEVRRNTQPEKIEEHHSTQRLSKRHTKSFGNISTAQTKNQQRDGCEIMEMIHIFDLESQPRLNQLLVTLMIQQYKHNLTRYQITINDVYFLFNEKPSLDKQEVYRVLIFYEYFDYSLQELSDHLQNTQLKLGHIQHLELSLHLLQILHSCYSSYLYRLNITLNTLYWVSKAKRFKLQTFGRIQNLLILDGKDDNAKFKNYSNESKTKTFYRDFERDFGAVLDIILHFRLLSTDVANIKKLRRKRKNLQEDEIYYSNYLLLYDETFNKKEDQVFQGLVRLRFFENNTFSNQLDEIQSIIWTLEKQIKDETLQQENELEELQIIEQNIQQPPEQIQENEVETEKFTSFDIHLDRINQQEYNEEQFLYYQMLYSSLLYSQNFNIMCDQFMAVAKNQLLIAYTQIHYSIWKKLNSIQKEGFCIEQQSTLQNIAKSLVQYNFNQDSFNYYLLLELIIKIRDKPLNLLLNLKQLLQEQNIMRRKQVKPKLNRYQRYNGIIEMRKALIIDIFYIDYYVSVHQYNKAISLMQHDISSQLKFNLKNYLLYNHSLLINGLLNEKTLQNVSAMLNLEISKLLYETYFPNMKTVYIEDETQRQVTKEQQESDKTYTPQTIYFDNQGCENMNVLDFHLGKVYFSLHDKENALKCLRRVKQARQKKFDILSDEVIEVIIEILKILVEQEDSGAAGEICYEYKEKFRDYYKKNFYFKSRYVARLQLIMAAIFECNGMIITSLRYYQRANRTFNQSKTNSYILQIHIRQQTMKLIAQIKQKTNLMKTLVGFKSKIEKEFNFSSGYLSEIVKPYFNNQFLRKTVEVKTTFENPIVFNYLLNIYSLFRYEDYEKAFKKLDKLLLTLKKRKVDESYGITLEKLASYNVIQKNYQAAINNFLLAIDIHERFLQFPQKESHILKCQIFILCCFSLMDQKKEFQDQLNLIDQFIAQFHETIQWNNIPYQSYSNKFKVLTFKLGKSFLYQIQDFYETVEKYQKVRYKLIQNLQNFQKLKQIIQKYLEIKIKDIKSQKSIKKLSITDQRQSCIFGQLSQQTIRHSRKSTFIAKDQKQKISQSDFDNLETQKSTQVTTTRSHKPLKDNEITILVKSENQQLSQVQADQNLMQKSLNSEDNIETERCTTFSNRVSSKKKDRSKCSTAIQSQILLTMTPISERVSTLSKQKPQKDSKKYKIDPFQKIKKK